MPVQIITANINGKTYDLHVEQASYNDHPAWYLTDKNIQALFGEAIPEHLVFFETDTGVEYSPRIVSVEGQQIARTIWRAIRDQASGGQTPQPFGPGLG